MLVQTYHIDNDENITHHADTRVFFYFWSLSNKLDRENTFTHELKICISSIWYYINISYMYNRKKRKKKNTLKSTFIKSFSHHCRHRFSIYFRSTVSARHRCASSLATRFCVASQKTFNIFVIVQREWATVPHHRRRRCQRQEKQRKWRKEDEKEEDDDDELMSDFVCTKAKTHTYRFHRMFAINT